MMNSPNLVPLVSIIIPVFNAERFIARTLQSALNQIYPNIEIIIVDDGSTDNSMEVCRSFHSSKIRIIRQKNMGLPGARNTGIRYSLGDYVSFLDSDDLWESTKLTRHITHLQASPQVGISFSYSAFIDESDTLLGLYQQPKRLTNITPDYILCRNPVGNGSAAVIRREVLEHVRQSSDREFSDPKEQTFFDEQLPQENADASDVEFWTRVSIQTIWKIEGIPEVLTYYRLTRTGLSANVLNQVAALQGVLDRTRRYAPEIVEGCERTARAYHLRYAARRMVTLRNSDQSLQLMANSLRSDWKILLAEPRRTLLTLGAVCTIQILPRRAYEVLEQFIFTKLIASRQPRLVLTQSKPVKTPLPTTSI